MKTSKIIYFLVIVISIISYINTSKLRTRQTNNEIIDKLKGCWRYNSSEANEGTNVSTRTTIRFDDKNNYTIDKLNTSVSGNSSSTAISGASSLASTSETGTYKIDKDKISYSPLIGDLYTTKFELKDKDLFIDDKKYSAC